MNVELRNAQINATVPENVLFFDTSISNEQINYAFENTYCWQFIDKLKLKEQTPIGPNTGPLSSGQKQRLLIARTIAKNAPVALLDEGTSNLDIDTERKVVQNIYKNFEGTVLSIAHSVEAYDCFDRFFLVQNGSVIETTFEELKQKGFNSA